MGKHCQYVCLVSINTYYLLLVSAPLPTCGYCFGLHRVFTGRVAPISDILSYITIVCNTVMYALRRRGFPLDVVLGGDATVGNHRDSVVPSATNLASTRDVQLPVPSLDPRPESPRSELRASSSHLISGTAFERFPLTGQIGVSKRVYYTYSTDSCSDLRVYTYPFVTEGRR